MIRAYTGLLGSGKTSSMITDARKAFRETWVQIYSDMRSLKFPGAVYLHYSQAAALGQVSRGLILLDEAGLVLSSRFWQSLDRSVIESMTMLRKNELDLFFATPDVSRVDKQLREIVSEIVVCRRFGKMVVQFVYAPDGKTKTGTRFCPLAPRAWALFDSWETFGQHGEGVGRSDWLDDLREARLGPNRRPEAGAVFDVEPGCWVGNSFRWRSDAIQAWKWLLAQGVYAEGEERQALIRQELRRREWLRDFLMDPQRVPPTVTYEQPWQDDWSPADVERRSREQTDIDDVLEKMTRKQREHIQQLLAAAKEGKS